MSVSWLLVSMYLILDLGIQINSIEQPIKCNSVSSGNVSHCRTSSFNDHFDYSFIVLKNIPIKLLDARIGHLKEQHQCLLSHRFSCETCDVCDHHTQVSLIHLKHEKHFQEQKQFRSHSSRAGNPSNLSPVSKEMISDSVEL